MLTPSHVGGSLTAHPKRWTGAGAGWVSLKLMSSEIAKIRGADGVRLTGTQYCGARHIASATRALRSRDALFKFLRQDPRHVWKLHAREPRDPVAVRCR